MNSSPLGETPQCLTKWFLVPPHLLSLQQHHHLELWACLITPLCNPLLVLTMHLLTTILQFTPPVVSGWWIILHWMMISVSSLPPVPWYTIFFFLADLDDLPLFLQNMVESIRMYSEWCEQMLAASYPLKISLKVNNNLQRQKSIVESHSKFVQEQIQLFRVSETHLSIVVAQITCPTTNLTHGVCIVV